MIKKLQSGELAKQLEALRGIIAQAMKNPAFAREFNRWVLHPQSLLQAACGLCA